MRRKPGARVGVLAMGISRRTIAIVRGTLERAGFPVAVLSGPWIGPLDLLVVSFGRETLARASRSRVPVLSLTRRPRQEEEALASGAWGALTLPVRAERLLEIVNRILVVGERRRLVPNLLGVRRWLRRLEEEGDPERALEFLYWAPKVADLDLLERRIPPARRNRRGFAGIVAREVAARAGRELFDDLLPLSIDLEFRLKEEKEGRTTSGEPFAAVGYYAHLLDAKLRIEELLGWRPVSKGLGPRVAAEAWIRTPQLDSLAVTASRSRSLPPLSGAELARLVRDLRRFHRLLKGR